MTERRRSTRWATNGDLKAVLTIDSLAPVGHERRELLTTRVAAGECLVCDEEGQILGYLILKSRSFFGRDFIELLAVDPRFRRRAVGRDLLRSALEMSATPDVFTSTNCSNRAMRELLDQEKWRLSGELEGIDEGDPELVFYKRVGTVLEG